jgi:hypothetical protein
VAVANYRFILPGLFFFLALAFFAVDTAWACVGCGQTRLFTPKLMAISMSFIILPVSIVLLIAWKLRTDAKLDAKANAEPSATSESES